MGLMYLLSKDGKLRHTYSQNVRDKLIEEGWRFEAFITGYNVSIEYRGE